MARPKAKIPRVYIKSEHKSTCRYYATVERGRRGNGNMLNCDCPKLVCWTVDGKTVRHGEPTLEAAVARQRREQEKLNKNATGQVAAGTEPAVPTTAKPPAVIPPAVTEPGKTKTVADAIQSFIGLKKDAVSRQTKERITQRHVDKLDWTLKKFLNFTKERGLVNLTDIEPEHVIGWRTNLKQDNGAEYAQSYKAKLLVYLTEFFAYCVEMRWIATTPVTKYAKVIAPDPKKPKALSDPQIKQLFAAIPKLKQNKMTQKLPALLLLMRHTGLAIRDAVTLKRSAISENGGGFWKVETARAKTNKPVYCTVTGDVARRVLAGANQAGKYLFVDSVPDGERELNYLIADWSKLVSKLGREASIKDEDDNILAVTSHWLRHSFVRWCFDNAMPTEDVAELIGDNVETVAAHYSGWIQARQERLTQRMKEALVEHAQGATTGT